MNRRGYKYNLKNYYEYFKDLDQDVVKDINSQWLVCEIFGGHMNPTYLHICCWNLYEKIIRGQKGFNEEAKCYIYRTIFYAPIGR